MTTRTDSSSDQLEQQREARRHRHTKAVHKRRPCGLDIPNKPTGLTLLFQSVEGTRHNRLRVKVDWNAVRFTESGDEVEPDAYVVQLQYSTDSTFTSADTIRHATVKGSKEDDTKTDRDERQPPTFKVFRNIKPRGWYRARVKAVVKNGCDGFFSDWTTPATANDNNPPDKPRNVAVSVGDKGRVVRVEWDAPLSAIAVVNDAEASAHDIIDDAIAYYQVQVATNSAFTTNVKTDRMHVGERKTFRYTKNIGDTVYARVASFDAVGNSKGWTAAVSSSTNTPSGVGTITRTRVAPRRIEFDWADSTDPDFDRYKVIILKADTSGGTYSVHDTLYTRSSRYRLAVAATDKTKWWKARVRVETYPDASGNRNVSGDSDSTADQADDESSGGPTVAPSTPTGVVTRRRLKAVLVCWDDVQNDATQEPVKYRVYASSSSISTTPSFNPASVTKGGESLVTRYWNGSSFVDFTKDSAGTTFYFRVEAKNAVGTSALSTQVTGSPKKKLSTQSQTDTFGTDDPDVTNVIADQFQAGTSGDRIVIADPTDGQAVLKFIGGAGNSTKFTVGNAGNVTVTGGKVSFDAGITLPSSANGSVGAGSIAVNTSYLYWKNSGGTAYRVAGTSTTW